MADGLRYELLVLDPADVTPCADVPALLHMLLGYSKLWQEPNLNAQEFQITDGDTILHVGHVR